MNRTITTLWTGVSLALALLMAPTARGGTGSPSSAATALPPAESRVIVARVGSREIQALLLSDAVEEAVNSGYFHQQMPGADRLPIEKAQLARLIRRELDLLGGLDKGLRPDLAAAKIEREKLEKKFGRERYELSIARFGWTREDHVRALAEARLSETAYRRFVAEPSEAGDEEVRKAFDADPKRWSRPEEIRVEHIFLEVGKGAPEARWKERTDEARKILAELEGGKDFASLASTRSEDMYRVKGGDLGWVHRGRLLPEVDKAIWEAPIGKLVGPIRSEEGIHLARVRDHRAAQPAIRAEVEPKLRAELTAKKRQAAEDAWYRSLSTRHPVVILDSRLKDLDFLQPPR